MSTREAAGRLHDSTKHGTPPSEPERLVAYRRLDPANMPNPFKEYRGQAGIDLPRDVARSSLPAVRVLSGARGESRLDISVLSTLLFLTGGVTRVMDVPGRRLYFRTAMSAGNLHPVEIYLITGEETVDGLGAGVYHFSPLDMRLVVLRSGDYRGSIGVTAAAAMVLTGIPWRTAWKYGERGWRHLYWDAGALLANTHAVADAHGIEHRTLLGFNDGRVAEVVGIDGEGEMPIAVLGLGEEGQPPPSPPLERLTLDVAPVAARPLRLPLLEVAQRAGSLSAGEVASWRCKGGEVATPAVVEVEAPAGPEDPIEDVILRRGSTRRMIRSPVARTALDWPMAASTRAVGIDAIPGATLLQHHANIHAVEGIDAAAYRHTGTGWDLIGRSESLREISARLCLGQELGGDSAYTVFHCAELDPLLAAFGSRGYRVAQLEAGVVSGRLALCAFALGLGATGLTFLDDVVSAFYGITAQPMLATAVGVPASRPAPSGSPAAPAVLRR